mmetsp:Transcript_36842/g.84905  ORF Transcript_36842/g.84905 Transcript_36842/m.84905 type:complete len:263 (-) Transcript_36842:345-1133(-)
MAIDVSTALTLKTAIICTRSLAGTLPARKHSHSLSSTASRSLSHLESSLSASRYKDANCGTSLRVIAPSGCQQLLLSAYPRAVLYKHLENTNVEAAITALPVYRRCPIMSMFATPACLCEYLPPSIVAYLSRSAVLGSCTLSKEIRALSRSFPIVFSPMSSKVTPATGLPLSLSVIKKAWGPRGLPCTIRFAITTAASAVNPCDIQFFFAPSSAQFSTNTSLASSHTHVVLTTRPLFTPAKRSVKQKHPNLPCSWKLFKLST